MGKSWLISVLSIFVFSSALAVTIEPKVVVGDLQDPWAVVTSPENTLWVTEIQGRIQIFDSQYRRQEPIENLPGLISSGQGGLLDLAFHPKFSENRWVYLAYVVGPHGQLRTRVTRFKHQDGKLMDPQIIIDGPKGTDSAHFGCRLVFDNQGYLYASFGERHQKEKAQNINELHGKVVRLHDDGRIPADNPFGAQNPVFTYGHRNPQGLDIQPSTGKIFVSEHGPSGYDADPGGDEINQLASGNNYGWPIIHHRDSAEGIKSPLREYTPAVAPSGLSFYTGNKIPEWKGQMFVATLRGARILRLKINLEGKVEEEESLLENEFGRIRDVGTAPDGSLIALTDFGQLLVLEKVN